MSHALEDTTELLALAQSLVASVDAQGHVLEREPSSTAATVSELAHAGDEQLVATMLETAARAGGLVARTGADRDGTGATRYRVAAVGPDRLLVGVAPHPGQCGGAGDDAADVSARPASGGGEFERLLAAARALRNSRPLGPVGEGGAAHGDAAAAGADADHDSAWRAPAEPGMSLADAQARLGQIAASLPGALYQFVHGRDGQYRFTYISEGLWRLGGFAEDATLQDFATFVAHVPEDEQGELLAAIQRSERTLEPLEHEFRLRTPRGTIWVEARSVPTDLGDGSVVCNGVLFDVTQRREAQETARRLNAILETTPDLVVLTDTDGYIEYLNAGGCQLLGFDEPEAVRGRLFLDFLTAVDAARERDEIVPLAARNVNHSREVTLVARDGTEIPVSQTTLCHRDAWGRATHFSAIVRDLSGRVTAERELAERERRFRQLYNRTPVMLHEADREGRITAVSDHWLEQLGYERAQVLGRDAGDFFTSESRRRLHEEVHPQFWRDGRIRNVALELVRRDGATMDVLLSADADEDDDEAGRRERCRVVMIDVTEQRRAEAGYRELFENASEGIYRSTPDGRLLRANPALVRLQGFDNEAALLEAVTDIAHQWYVDPNDREHMQALLARDGQVEGFEAEIHLVGTGERLRTSENVRAVYGGDGALLYYEGTVRDITASYRAQQLATRRSEILEMIARDAPLTGTLYEIVGALEQTHARLTAAIFRLQDGRLYTAAAPGLANACIRAVDGVAPSQIGSAIARAIRGDHAAVDDQLVRAHSAFAQAAHDAGYGAVVAVPVHDQRGAALGVLAAFVQYAREAEDERIQMLSELAQITSIAIEQFRLSQELLRQAQYDTLTRLPNRALLAERLQQALAEAHREASPVAVILLDLDEFKLVNDTLGHSAGDALLGQVAERLRSCVRPSDTVARLGGDEFVIVVPLRGGEIGDVAERVVATLQTSLSVAGREVTACPSMGIALYPEDGVTSEALLQAADTAMYAAKNGGKNRFRFFSADMNAEMTARLRTEAELRSAIEGDELTLHYQPRVALATGAVVGAEGLLRWNHPERGLLEPDAFLATAERGPLMPTIDRRVIEHVARQAARWQGLGQHLVVSANLSANELHTDGFGQEVARVLSDAGVDPAGLELEITESILMHDFERATRQLRDLKERAPGLRIAIDDFGSGYSSLNYLRYLPIDTLKIDRSFVADLNADDATAGAIVRTIVELGRNLGLNLVAEGVERPEQARRLFALGCDQAQGFWYGPAVPVDEFDDRLAS